MSDPLSGDLILREFSRRRDGMIHAMDGGLWLHRHVWFGRAMAHLVSTDRERLLAYGRHAGLPSHRLQHKPLRDPRTSERRDAWHWDLVGTFLPPPGDTASGEADGRHPHEEDREDGAQHGRLEGPHGPLLHRPRQQSRALEAESVQPGG